VSRPVLQGVGGPVGAGTWPLVSQRNAEFLASAVQGVQVSAPFGKVELALEVFRT